MSTLLLAHFSDTHLGFSEYAALDPKTGINLREQDFYDAFRAAVEGILDLKPDLVIHAGDLFDGVRPANRAIAAGLEGFARLSRAGIPCVVIAGNHETPRIRTTGSILRALASLPGVHPVFDGEYRAVDLGRAVVHAVSDAPTEAELAESLGRVEAVPRKINVLTAHGGVGGANAGIVSGEYNEHQFPLELLKRFGDFDYVALGHYHKHMSVDGLPRAWYSGSTERTSFGQAAYTPGFVTVALPGGVPAHHAIPVRPMLDFSIPCRGLGAAEVLEALERAISGRLAGTLSRIVFRDISAGARAGLDPKAIRERTAGAAHVVTEFVAEEGERGAAAASLAIHALPSEWDEFMTAADVAPGHDRAALRQRGRAYLEASDEGEIARED